MVYVHLEAVRVKKLVKVVVVCVEFVRLESGAGEFCEISDTIE